MAVDTLKLEGSLDKECVLLQTVREEERDRERGEREGEGEREREREREREEGGGLNNPVI